MSNKKPEKKKRSVMTLILKIISGLLIAAIIFIIGFAALLKWGSPTISNHPSGEEIERIRHEKNQYQY